MSLCIGARIHVRSLCSAACLSGAWNLRGDMLLIAKPQAGTEGGRFAADRTYCPKTHLVPDPRSAL